MFLIQRRRLWPCALLFGTSWAIANPSDPTDPQAPVAPPVYSSAFTGYRSSGDLSPRPWRDTIDTVGRRGGWRAYAREAAQDADRSGPRAEPRAESDAARPAPALPAVSAPAPMAPAGQPAGAPADASPRSKATP